MLVSLMNLYGRISFWFVECQNSWLRLQFLLICKYILASDAFYLILVKLAPRTDFVKGEAKHPTISVILVKRCLTFYAVCLLIGFCLWVILKRQRKLNYLDSNLLIELNQLHQGELLRYMYFWKRDMKSQQQSPRKYFENCKMPF